MDKGSAHPTARRRWWIILGGALLVAAFVSQMTDESPDGNADATTLTTAVDHRLPEGDCTQSDCPPEDLRDDLLPSDLPDVGPDKRPADDSTTENTVVVGPEEDLRTILEAHPPGTRFLLTAGIHEVDRVVLRDGDVIVGERGTIVSGGGVFDIAFVGDADNVTITGLVIEGYMNEPQYGAIHTDGTDWLVEYNEFRNNAGAGLGIGPGWVVRHNHVHHNEQIGLISTGADHAIIEDNELAFNNFEDRYDMAWEAGGAKFVRSRGLIVRRNYVHDNHGVGLWTDANNIDTVYEANIVIDNYGPGIFHEISYDAEIRYNYVKGNGHEFYLGGILVAGSSNVAVYGNLLIDNNGGVVGLQEDRGVGLYGPWLLDGLDVRSNRLSYSVGWTGVLDQIGDEAVFKRTNRFHDNTYDVPADHLGWQWGDEISWDAWKELGFS